MINAIFLFLAIVATMLFIFRLVFYLCVTILIHKEGKGTIKFKEFYWWTFFAALFWTLFFAL